MRHYDGGPDYQTVAAYTRIYILKAGADTLMNVRWAVARELGLPGSLPNRFCAQVYRALTLMVGEGLLVKTGGGPHSDPWYWTPERRAEHERQLAADRAREHALAERWVKVHSTLESMDFAVYSSKGKPVELDLEAWERLLGVQREGD